MGKAATTGAEAWPAAFLALADHCADVTAVMAVLLELPVIRSRLHRLTGGAVTEAHCRAILGATFLHDIGKANRGFWRKQWPTEERGRGPICGHLREVAPLLFGPNGIRIAEAGPYLDPRTPAGALLMAALGHHGEPIPFDQLKAEAHIHARFWQPADGYDPVAEARGVAEPLARWLPESLHAAERLAPLPPALLRGFLGLSSLADWIASNAVSAFFPCDGHGAGDRWLFARARVREVVRAMRLDG
ncbi:CRISPR-associated endonuclease Cas3'' [Elioraea sp. Yellowstone]|uniref:CRISPR-associated endonuclease Cas3'' n=1 Tax=Elioraea sp. Yellowstone TaxID=2592070 RepID=UPI0013866087|nr:CRISPR-associated endonuclease Cas3'' [Elioraea sp. Yellowstone]